MTFVGGVCFGGGAVSFSVVVVMVEVVFVPVVAVVIVESGTVTVRMLRVLPEGVVVVSVAWAT